MPKKSSKQRQSGQTLLLGMMAVVILLFVFGFMFDLQSVIRAKFKTKTGVDAAALAGGNWQRHTLNMIGDINLIKASTLMLTEISPSGGSLTTETDALNLAASSNNLTEMQTRAGFIGPLVGFGAAQQAAKANGLNYRKEYADVLREHLNQLENSDVYEPPNTTDIIDNFEWRKPYIAMIYALYENGFGIAVSGNRESVLYPTLNSSAPQFIGYLTDKKTYEAINGNFWCGIRGLLRETFSGDKWYGDITIAFNSSTFIGESEYFPVGITSSRSRGVFDTASDPKQDLLQPWLDKRGFDKIDVGFDKKNPTEFGDLDGRFDPIRYLAWATLDAQFWGDYEDSLSDDWEAYLRAPIARKFRYYGCNARVKSVLDPVAASGQFLPVSSMTNTSQIRDGKQRLNEALYQIQASALAKPLGSLKTADGQELPPHRAGRMILPCFERTVLIPTALEPSSAADEFDYQWYAFLTEYLPALGTVGSVSQMGPDVVPVPEHWGWFTGWHAALLKLSDPAWRQQGLDWLDDPVLDKDGKVVGTNEDKCDVPPPGGPGPRPPGGPGSLH